MAGGGIRRATSSEAAEIAELYLRSRRAAVPAIPPIVHPDDDVRRWVREEVFPNRDVWVWANGAELSGLLVLNGTWLDHLYIDPDHLGEGLGTALLEHAQSMSPAGLKLWTFQSNLGARRFYERHGFVEGESTDGDNEEGAPDVLYRWRPGS
jgi:GNAT superfamily N-acetyltransferase